MNHPNVSGSKKAKRRAPLTDSELVDLTIERFKGLTESGRAASFSDLSKRFGERNPSVLVRGVAKAFKEGLVEVCAARPAVRAPRLEERLKLELGLPAAVVVDLPSNTPPGDGDENENFVAELLGTALAQHLASGLLPRGTAIGVGPGRAVFWTAKKLERTPLATSDVSIFSLGGRSGFTRPPAVNHIVDADTNAARFAEGFSRKVDLHQMGVPLVVDSVNLTSTLRETWIGTHPRVSLSYVLLGAGTLSSDGQILHEGLRSLPPLAERLLAPILPKLTKLESICAEGVTKPRGSTIPYSPVGDIGNYLFFVSPRLGYRIDHRAETAIRATIREINDSLVTVKRGFLMTGRQSSLLASDEHHEVAKTQERERRYPPEIILVAGTEKKAFPVFELLEQQYPVGLLCTDAKTATVLLEMKRSPKN